MKHVEKMHIKSRVNTIVITSYSIHYTKLYVWDVWNSGVIPSNIQNRIFQRHFSTKASVGRGLGTFSMKLFGEKYLKGKVSFLSSVEKGTTFTFKLAP